MSGLTWEQITQMVVTLSPLFAVLFCGFLLGRSSADNATLASLCVAIGTGLMLGNHAVHFVFYGWLLSRLTEIGMAVQTIMSLVGFIQGAINALGVALLIAAAFVERARPYGESSAAMSDDGR